jgi:uncharacterized protein YhjY with autotransporter beta-barrel domain
LLRRPRKAPRGLRPRAALLRLSVCFSAVVFTVSLCVAASAQTQPPGVVFGDAIYGPNRDGNPQEGSICGRLNELENPASATQDLTDRCNDLAPTQQPAALRQVADEEIATQGTSSVETSSKQIGARLAALRGGAIDLSLHRFSLDLDEPRLPGTLVASLLPYAALSSTVPATTPHLFKRFGVFANGDFSFGDRDTTLNESGYDFHTFGVTAGADYRFTDNFVLGVALSYQSTGANLDRSVTTMNGLPAIAPDGGNLDVRSFSVSLYGTYYVTNRFYVDGIVTLGWNDYAIDRIIRYGLAAAPDVEVTRIDQTAQGDTNSNQYAFSFGAGYEFHSGGFTFGPLGRVDYTRIDIDGYQETIANTNPGFGWALAYDSQGVESLLTFLGGDVSYAISTGLGVLLPQLRFEWAHEFLNDSRTITAWFVGDPAQQRIRTSTDDPDRDFVNLAVGLAATFPHGVSAFVNYETVLALDNVTRHSITLGVRVEL